MTTAAAYVVVKDNELLIEAEAPDQTFPLFDAPDADLEVSPVLTFRLRPNTSHGDVRLRMRLNQQFIVDDSFFDSVKRTWTEVIGPGILADSDNELRVELISPDGSEAPPGSALGVSNVTMSYSIQISS